MRRADLELTLTERELRNQCVVLRTDLRPALPRLAGDRVHLQEVLLNLILNVIEAMSAVEIVSRQDAADAELIEDRDCGHGLDHRSARWTAVGECERPLRGSLPILAARRQARCAAQ